MPLDDHRLHAYFSKPRLPNEPHELQDIQLSRDFWQCYYHVDRSNIRQDPTLRTTSAPCIDSINEKATIYFMNSNSIRRDCMFDSLICAEGTGCVYMTPATCREFCLQSPTERYLTEIPSQVR